MNNDPEKEHEKMPLGPQEKQSVLIASGLLLTFFVGALGFFWGHKVAVNRFLHKVDEEAFSDKIMYALYNINGLEQEGEESLEEAIETKDAVEVEVIQEVVETGDIVPEDTDETNEEKVSDDGDSLVDIPNEVSQTSVQEQEEIVYAAPLIGFGTLHAAELFVQKLKERDITVIIKQRLSTTARGRKIKWYQVVTPEYARKKDLEELIALIQKKEKLHNVTIIEKRKVKH